MDTRAQRIERNEAFFREVNTQIERLASPTTVADMHIVCECASVDCMRVLEVRPDLYQETRSHPRRFLVANGHQLPDVEVVVRDEGDYLVVEKIEPPPSESTIV